MNARESACMRNATHRKNFQRENERENVRMNARALTHR